MEKTKQKRSFLAVLIATSLACSVAGSAVMFSRLNASAAEGDETSGAFSVWDGDLIAAGWGEESVMAPAEYEVTYESDDEGKISKVEIGSAAAFAWFAHEVYVDDDHNLDGAEVTLTTNIDLDNHMWIPIGETVRKDAVTDLIGFSGTFDGGNKTIKNFSTEKYVAGLENLTTSDGVSSDGYYHVYEYKSEDKGYTKTKAYIPYTVNGDKEFAYGLFTSAYNVTIKNLNVTNVYYNLSRTVADTVPDAIGVLIGYVMGEVTIDNCRIGSTDHASDNNSVTLRDGAGGYGALVGRLYASTEKGKPNYQKVEISNCVNYLNVDVDTTAFQTGGLIGLFNYSSTAKLERLVNYGNVKGDRNNVGGIVGTWTPSNTTTVGATTEYCWFFDCDNFGNIYGNSYVGGLIGDFYDNQCKTVKFIADGNVNYGNVGGKYRVGGLFGTTDTGATGASIMKVITNNYNYGDVYSFSAESVGGYIGYDYSTSFGEKIYVVSGGNFGTIYGSASFKGQNYGGTDRTGSNGTPAKEPGSVLEAKLTKRFLIAAGELVLDFDTVSDMPAPKYSEPVFDRHLDAVSRKVEDGKYTLSDTNDLVYEYTHDDGTFVYADAAHTIIIGVSDEADVSGTVTIPATVTTIGHAAFAGNKDIQVIKFAEDNQLTSIEDAAFAGCSNLNHVILPANASSISLGKGVFNNTRADAGVFLLAENNAQYQQLRATASYADYRDLLTHVVTINYHYDGKKVEGASEERLHGQKYNVTLQDGLWASRELPFRGPNASSSDQPLSDRWYDAPDRLHVVTDSSINNMLLVDTDSIELHAFSKGDDDLTWYAAREGIVYDPNKTYTVRELQSLLHPSSSTIDPDSMDIRIEYDGEEVSEISNAGTYTVSIDSYVVIITIEKATLNLANLANLEWQLEGVNNPLMSGALYIYKDKDGKDYPSLQPLDAEQIAALNLNGLYEIRTVNYSIVRNRGTNTIVIVGSGYDEIDYDDDTTYTHTVVHSDENSAIGSYKAKATLTANGNYIFTVGQVDGSRGLTIVINADGTATVTKEWYIVDLGNSIILGALDHTYGDEPGSAAPYLAYGVGTDNARITMSLTLNNRPIGSDFGIGEFYNYINSSMPAGEYRLTVTIPSVKYTDPADNVEVVLSGYTETFIFTVEKRALPSLTALDEVLKGAEFAIEESDGRMYIDSNSVVGNYLNLSATFARTGEWAESDYDDLFSGFTLKYNFAGSDAYNSVNDIGSLQKGEYTVYYEVSALNYSSSIEGVSRYEYKYTLIKYHVVTAPDIKESNKDLTYTGSTVLPKIAESDDFEVIWGDMEDYVSAGTHTVTLKLLDSKLTRWAGHEDDGKVEVEAEFEIKQASNEFTVSPNMLGWAYHDRGAANYIRAVAVFGVLHFAVMMEGESTAASDKLADFAVNADGSVSAEVESALNELKGGTYVLRVWVVETADYTGLDTEETIKFSISKLQNSWKNGSEDLSLPNWIVGRYNPDESPLVVKATAGVVQYRIEDMNGNPYYDSSDPESGDLATVLNSLKVGKYLLTAWVNGDDDYSELAERTFVIEVFEAPGLPWWVTLVVTVGALGLAALIIFILWKKGVFQILTEKIVVAIRTRASVEATIASVRAAKMMEEGRQSVAEAKRRERLEQMRQKAQEQRNLSPEERAAQLAERAAQQEAKAQAEAERAEKMRVRAENALAKAEKQRREEGASQPAPEAPAEPAEAAEPAKPETPDTPPEE